MSAIHIRRHLDSHVLNLPEITSLVGKDVGIIVVEACPPANGGSHDIEIQAMFQGTRPVQDGQSLMGGWPEDQRDDEFELDLERRNEKNLVPPFREE